MATQLTLGQQIVVADLRTQQLLQDAVLIGGVYTMGFDECLVLTNDIWKRAGGGVPQHCFLLATAMQAGQASDVEDEEVILLRVVGPAPLPAEAELVAIRAEAMREIVTTQGVEVASSSPAILDVLTRNEIQFSAFRAKILGTFYETEVDGTPLLAFGSDVETFYSVSRYKVYKPYGASLSIIASYPERTVEEERRRQATKQEPARVRIGAIRYTSTQRRHERVTDSKKTTAVPVRVNIDDFIAMKSAVFGMTRLGKSNTMKILATAIFEHAKRTGQVIGQLFFDPAGEYANVNVQDKTAISQIGTEYVTIFRFGASGNQVGIRPLSVNFFSDQTIEVSWSVICAFLQPRNQSNYVKSFLAADVVGPEREEDDRSAWSRARRRRAALYATLLKAGFQPPENFSTKFLANQEVVSAVNIQLEKQHLQPIQSDARGNLQLNTINLVRWFDALTPASSTSGFPSDWIDPSLDAILTLYRGSVGSGYRLLEPLKVYHAPNRDRDYAEEVLDELVAGKIVIVDLSLGSEAVLKFSSERIVNHIVQDAARRFADGKSPRSIQIYIEEAHRLFSRDRMSTPAEADPYVRLAKEAAKFKIGLIYATQEVTSVDPIILSNTSNWIVTHLNNRNEIKELSKYYDFEDFAELTLEAEDVGFVRLKTRSSRYIIPVQIDLFDPDRIAAAKQAALQAQSRRK